MRARVLLLMLLIASLPAGAQQGSSQLRRIALEPSAGFINGVGGQHAFVLSGYYQDGSARDLTRQAMYVVSDPSIVQPAGPGAFAATSEGVTKITAAFGGFSAEAAIIVNPSGSKAWEFTADIAPIFSKLGCNNNNCHGALNGQNGFKLSLFGYDPPADFQAIVQQASGRRINRESPEKSLILEKPTATIAHGGGKRMEKDSPEYATLLKWIQDGAPLGKATGPRLLSIRVAPSGLRVLQTEAERQQLVVLGNYADGSRADLTRKVHYVSSDEEVASVSASGLVSPKRNGEATILVRTLGQVGAMRIAVTLGRSPVDLSELPRHNFIDELVLDKLAKLRITPSALSGDAQFLRRVYLDVTGALPTAKEAAGFLEDQSPQKRERLIDSLLARPEFAQFWALKWGDLFMIRAIYNMNNSAYAHEYFRGNFASDRPYNEVAREMLTGVGALAEVGPNNFYSREDRRPPEEYATLTAQTFLGVSLECARCHDHPREKWTRDDFLGLAAFFSQVKMKERNGYRPFEGFVTLNYGAEFKHPQSRQIVRPRLLGGAEPSIGPMVDRREILADWVVSPDNPYFAKATVNRIWKQLMSRGLVEPVDDFRATNPPTHPELLDRLAAYFVDQGFRLKPLMGMILKSRTYQLAAASHESNAGDSINYSRYYIRRFSAEQLLDAVSAVTGLPESFLGFYRGKRAIDLPDPDLPSYFLATFDRPVRDTARCERNTTATMTQAMHFLNGETIQAKISSPEGSLRKMIQAGMDDNEIIRSFYLSALSRLPKQEEIEIARVFVSKQKDREQGLQGVVWALLNSKEFSFNH